MLFRKIACNFGVYLLKYMQCFKDGLRKSLKKL